MSYTPPNQHPNYNPGQTPGQAPNSAYAGPQFAAPQQPAVGYAPIQLPPPGPGEPFDGATHPDQLTRPLYGASFGQAISRFFKSYARFSGRASRSEFWWVQLFLVIVQIIPVPFFVVGIVMLSTAGQGDAAVGTGIGLTVFGGVVMGVLYLALLIPSIAISWRRLHDVNFAGPFWFLTLTSAGSIVVLVFTLLPSKPEGRRFDIAA